MYFAVCMFVSKNCSELLQRKLPEKNKCLFCNSFQSLRKKFSEMKTFSQSSFPAVLPNQKFYYSHVTLMFITVDGDVIPKLAQG